MAWIAKVNLDSDKDDVGLVQCVWNEGQPDQFVYNGRIRISSDGVTIAADGKTMDNDVKELVAKAKNALLSRDAKLTSASTLAKVVEGVLNG